MASESRFNPLPKPVPIKEQAWPEGTRPLLCTTTYAFNHQRYIRDCIESILAQKTTFPVRICIHDDASNDQTPKIIREYQEAFPATIWAYFQEINTFWHPDKIKLQSTYRSWMEAGQYIAACEGDDYWLDPLKLHRQVQLLEENPELFLCAHDVEIAHEDISAPKRERFYDVPCEGSFKFEFTDYLANHFFHTASRVSRVPADLDMYHRLVEQPAGADELTNLWFLSMGKGYYMADKMAFKRRGSAGFTNSATYRDQDFRLFNRYRLMQETARFAPKSTRERVLIALGDVERQLFKRHFQKGKLLAALKVGLQAAIHDPQWICRKLKTKALQCF